MVRPLKVVGMFLFGMLLIGALAWPRITPRARYYVDAKLGLYHTQDDCPYGRIYAFGSRKEAGKLDACPFCVSPKHRDKIADSDSQNDRDQSD